MTAMFDWNDLRYFLAVADKGSTLSAGRAMRVSQTTVARRIGALERAIGVPLFDRRQAGYVLTPTGAALLDRARSVEAAATGFDDAAAAQGRDVSGTVRLTTEEIFANTVLGPMLRELHELHPDIIIELDTARELRDLGAGEADITLRGTKAPAPAGVVGRRLGVDDWTLYCSRDYAVRHGAPKTVAELRGHALIGGGGGNLWRVYEAWIHDLGLKKLLMIVAAGAALVTATTASAQYSGQYGGYRQGNDWNTRSGGYSRFDQQYRHTIQGIQHGLNDGTYSRSRANEFFRELQIIRRDAYRAQQYGNYRDDYVQARMARLHGRMHRKHDRNRARQDGYGQYNGGYGVHQPRYEEPRDGHDGHDDDA